MRNGHDEKTRHQTSAGPLELPIVYEDASNAIALFDGDLAACRKVLEGTGLEPAIVRGGRAQVAMSFYEYRRTSIGPYNEVATAIFAKRPGDRGGLYGLAEFLRDPRRRGVGAWVVDLPVTTETANVAGRELWGYPKFVTGIDFALAGRSVKGAVHDPAGGPPLCTLAGTMGPSMPIPALSLLTYTQLRGTLLRTPVDVRAPTRVHLRGDVRLHVGPSRHRMAENLRALGLDGAAPAAIVATERFTSLLHAGAPA